MQGVFINYRRPKSKKAVKEAIAAGELVTVEATSMFGNEYDGPVAEAPPGTITFVGPDPYRDRRFYGTITVSADGTVKVK